MKTFIVHECNSRRLHITPKGFEDAAGNVFNTFRAKLLYVVGLPTNRVELTFSQYGEEFCLDLDSNSRDGRFVQSTFARLEKPCGREYVLYATASAICVSFVCSDGGERVLNGYPVTADPSRSDYICGLNTCVDEPLFDPDEELDEDPYDDGSES